MGMANDARRVTDIVDCVRVLYQMSSKQLDRFDINELIKKWPQYCTMTRRGILLSSAPIFVMDFPW